MFEFIGLKVKVSDNIGQTIPKKDRNSSSVYNILGVKDTNADHCASHLGKAIGTVTLLRSTLHHAKSRRILWPTDVLLQVLLFFLVKECGRSYFAIVYVKFGIQLKSELLSLEAISFVVLPNS